MSALTPEQRSVMFYHACQRAAKRVGAERIRALTPGLIAAGYLTPGNCTWTPKGHAAMIAEAET